MHTLRSGCRRCGSAAARAKTERGGHVARANYFQNEFNRPEPGATVVQIIYPPNNCSYCVCELENFWVFAKFP